MKSIEQLKSILAALDQKCRTFEASRHLTRDEDAYLAVSRDLLEAAIRAAERRLAD